MEKRDSEILKESVDDILCEFFDEYIILGKKAGRTQRMVIASDDLMGNLYGMSEIFKKVMDWAHRRNEFKE